MFCDGCSGSYPTYYRMGRLNVCENCIKNTYIYRQLESKIPHVTENKVECVDEVECVKTDFNIHEKCSEYDSLCSQRERFLEKMYFDVDRLILEMDSHKYLVKRNKKE